MHTRYSDSPLWRLLPPDLQPAASFRRSNFTVIAILFLLVLGLVIIGFMPVK
jgi:hypothetical protein